MEASAQNLPRRLGRYEIVGRLAFGGMAEILLGRLVGPGGFERPVVIKRILPQLTAEPAFVDMFLDEGRLAAHLRHPNVLPVQELCREDGELFLVMEYLEGEALSGIARRCRARARPLDRSLAAHIVAEAAAGLHAAHELRDHDGAPLDIVHRDVSPENVFVSYDGTVKVLDFGIAKARDRITKTEAGMLKGKFEYMSPEQALGEPLDRRSDVFSLGVVLYEMTTGHRLFKRSTPLATLRAVTDDEIVLPSVVDPGYPRALEEVCMTALRRDRELRFANAQELRRALLEALRALSGSTMPEEALASLMGELFADRIADKQAMLTTMRQGVTPIHVPEAEVDVSVELPSIGVGLASEVRTRPFERTQGEAERGGRSKRPLLLAGAVVVLSVAAGSYAFFGPWREPTGSEPRRDHPALSPANDEVRVAIDSDPAGAVVLVDGDARGVTPVELRLPRGEAPLHLRLERDGFAPLEQLVTPRRDQSLRLSLSAQLGGAPAASPPPTPTKTSRARRGAAPAPRGEEPAERTEPAVGGNEAAPTAGSDPDREFRRFN